MQERLKQLAHVAFILVCLGWMFAIANCDSLRWELGLNTGGGILGGILFFAPLVFVGYIWEIVEYVARLFGGGGRPPVASEGSVGGQDHDDITFTEDELACRENKTDPHLSMSEYSEPKTHVLTCFMTGVVRFVIGAAGLLLILVSWMTHDSMPYIQNAPIFAFGFFMFAWSTKGE